MLDAREVTKGVVKDPAKVLKCEASFEAAVAKAEAKGTCHTTGDTGDVEAEVDAFVADLDDALSVGAPNKCQGVKIKAAATEATCKLVLEAKQAAKGPAVDPAKVAKCETAFAKTFAKSEAKGECSTTGDAAGIGSMVDAFVVDVDRRLSP